MTPSRLKILIVLGTSRSGSTLLGNLLGQQDSWSHAGEVQRLQETLARPARRCGCGDLVRECAVWSAVIADACAGGETATDEAALARPTETEAQPDDAESLSGGRLYRALAEVTGSRIIVDSSKEPSHAMVAAAAEGVEAYVLHLIRDPRAVVFSRTRRPHNKQRGPYGGTVYAVANWMKTNLAVERICRRGGWPVLRLRYEDLTECPQDVVRDVCEFLSEKGGGLRFDGARSAVLGTQHTVAGNRMRFACGRIEIKEDDEWQRWLPRRDRLVVTTLALPLLVRYGYAIRPATTGEQAGLLPGDAGSSSELSLRTPPCSRNRRWPTG